MKEKENEATWLYRLLMDKSYRWFRHLILWITVTLITFNQLYHLVEVQIEENYKYVYIPIILTLILYLAGAYVNIYYLIPRFFLTRRFGWYMSLFILLVVGISQLLILGEYLILQIPGIYATPGSYFYKEEPFLFAFLSDTSVLTISLFGISITVILKSWLLETKELNTLKNRKVRIEVEQVKEKVSPAFLYSILHTMGELAPVGPQQASAMLLHLSRLLRYQLYEGNQEKVLLTAEIQFLSNYLLLEQYHTPGFDFRIKTEGQISFLFVSTLLFLPFIQQGIKDWKESASVAPLEFFFIEENKELLFKYIYPESLQREKKMPAGLLKRFRLIYTDYFQVIDNNKVPVDNSFNLILQI